MLTFILENDFLNCNAFIGPPINCAVMVILETYNMYICADALTVTGIATEGFGKRIGPGTHIN